jgi:hypothetical protein
MYAYLDYFQDCVELKNFPLIDITQIQYVDSAGDTQTLSTDVYTVDADSTPGRFYLSYNQSWPTTRSTPKAVTVSYRAGYATTFTAASETDVLTVGNAYFADTDRVRLSVSAEDNAALPAGLSADTDYYVRDVSGSTLKLSLTSGGAAIDITDTGTGTFYMGFAQRGVTPDRAIWAMKLIVGHLYEHREEDSEMALTKMPFSVQNILFERVW